MFDAIIEQIKRNGNLFVQVYTHTDSIGSKNYNQRLSQRRAQAMQQMLIENGIDPADIKVQGMGEDHPIADNDTKAGQAINRRGEFVFTVKELEQ